MVVKGILCFLQILGEVTQKILHWFILLAFIIFKGFFSNGSLNFNSKSRFLKSSYSDTGYGEPPLTKLLLLPIPARKNSQPLLRDPLGVL